LGKAEGQSCPNEGQGRPEESLWSQADESCYAEEAVGDDESTVGSEEEGVGKNAARCSSTIEFRHRADSKADSQRADSLRFYVSVEKV
jgi:hypothetical protein